MFSFNTDNAPVSHLTPLNYFEAYVCDDMCTVYGLVLSLPKCTAIYWVISLSYIDSDADTSHKKDHVLRERSVWSLNNINSAWSIKSTRFLMYSSVLALSL